MTLFNRRISSGLVICAMAFVSACGSDSTGPGSVDANGALQSLLLGMQNVSGDVSPTTPEVSTGLSGIAPLLDRVNVTINGTSRSMFALGLHQTFPDGTCAETLFIDPQYPPPPGECTPPSLGLSLFLWQSHSPTEPPDRMIFIQADPGTTDFNFASSVFDYSSTPTSAIPGFALYVEGLTSLWTSLSGSLTSQVTGTSQDCGFPLPPYAKSGSCKIASFDEQGSIVFEELTGDNPNNPVTLVIPRQTLDGLLLAITEVQSVPLTASRGIPGVAGMRRLSRFAPLLTRAR